jgi:hypothetical protein
MKYKVDYEWGFMVFIVSTHGPDYIDVARFTTPKEAEDLCDQLNGVQL